MPSLASFGGSSIFGLAVRVTYEVNPPAAQINAFFGVSGTQSLFGGTRGGVFLVQGLLAADNLSDLASLEANFNSFNDGIARTFVDTWGNAYPQVTFASYARTGDKLLVDPSQGVFQQYKAMFTSLT